MKVIGIVLVLCLAGAMGQTMAPTQIECFLANVDAINQLGDGCWAMMSPSLPPVTDIGRSNITVNHADIQAFCSSSCAGLVNTYLMENCQSQLVVGLCSMDDEGFCVHVKNHTTFVTSIARAIAVSCRNTNCSDSTCNSAVQNASCCFGSLFIVNEARVGAEIAAFIQSLVLPSGCVAPVCDTNVGGGASLIIAMPVAVVMSLLLALVAIL